jgi:hypothetical protein
MTEECQPCARKCTFYCSVSVLVVLAILILIMAVVGVVSFCNLIHNQAGFIFGEYACLKRENLMRPDQQDLRSFAPHFQWDNAVYLGVLTNNLSILPCIGESEKKSILPAHLTFDEIVVERLWTKHFYAVILYHEKLQITLVYLTSLKSIFILTDIIFRGLHYDPNYLPHENVKCHQGVFNVYRRMQQELHDRFRKKYLHKTRQIVFFGHSLGGCVALLAALDFQNKYAALGPGNVFVYSYSAPRTGNQAFVRYYNSRVPHTFRIVNVMDGCTMLPVSDAKNQYEHAGHPVMLEFDRGVSNNHSITVLLKYLMRNEK